MYNLTLKLLHKIPPETAHFLTIKILKYSFKNKKHEEDPILYQHIFGLDFFNPIGLAAGFDKDAEVIKPLLNL